MIRAPVLAVVFPLLVAGLSRPQEKPPPKLVISKEAQMLIDLTNQTRVKNKLNPLKPNALLFQCAQGHSENMARLMKAGHVIDGKTTPADRVDATGYFYKTCGENVAQSPPNFAQIPTVFNGWMNSPIHKAEILRPEYEEIGIGIARDAKGYYYFTQVFGTELKKAK